MLVVDQVGGGGGGGTEMLRTVMDGARSIGDRLAYHYHCSNRSCCCCTKRGR